MKSGKDMQVGFGKFRVFRDLFDGRLVSVFLVLEVFPIAAAAQGVLEATLTSGKRVTELRYARRDDIVRIEDLYVPKKGVAPPVNLLNLKSGDLTIFHRGNSTFMKVPAERLSAVPDSSAAMPGMSHLAQGIGPNVDNEGRLVSRDLDEQKANGKTPQPPGTAPSAENANQRGAAGRPQMPPQMQAMINGPGGTRGMPMMPPMPPMPGIPGREGPTRLKKTDEVREIYGVQCTKYTMSDPREGNFEIWAADDLIPFFLLTHDAPRLRRRRELHESWPATLREKGLFPMLAILKDEDGEHEILRFEVTSFDPEKKPEDASLFKVPPGFHEIEPLPF